MEERYEIKVSKLRKITCKTEYEDKLNQRWERVRDEAAGEIEGSRRQSWKWKRNCVGKGKLGKGRSKIRDIQVDNP